MKIFRKLITFMVYALNIQDGQKCILNSRQHFHEPLPVIIRNGQLLEPTDKYGNIELDYGETITVSCEGSGPLRHPNTQREETTANIKCDGGYTFKNEEWLSSPADFTQFRCSYPPEHKSRRTNRTCFGGNRIFEVGYKVGEEFYPLYESCFNDNNYNAVYSKYTQKPYNANYQTKVDRPFFKAEGVYGNIPVESLFSPRGLKSAVGKIVGPMIDTYVTGSDYLSRGHLAAKTDFVFAFGERATFHYVNCVPQWYGFNGGNWNTLEVDLRNHINSAGHDTIIYTGSYHVSTLKNQFQSRVDIYLYTDENNNPVVPVPLYLYKVVYESSTQRGIAFIGINNPYYDEFEVRSLFFCKDVCRGNSRFSWLTWHPNNAHEGYTFCCTVPDFRRVVHHLPEFEVNGLLFE